MSPHAGRGKGLEAWVAGELAAAWRVGMLSHHLRLEPAMRAIGKGRFSPTGDAPPDFLAVCQDGTAVFVECKEHAGSRWDLIKLEAHQADHLSALPGSLVVVRWTEAPTLTVALPWALLGPLWREHAGRSGKAAQGTASLTRQQAFELGTEVGTGAQALGWAIVDAARDAARNAA